MNLATVQNNVSEALDVFGPVQRIIRHAARLSSVPISKIAGETRSQHVCWVRWAVIWAARHQGHSYPRIAKQLGKRDHSTIMHGFQRAEELRQSDPVFKALCDELEAV